MAALASGNTASSAYLCIEDAAPPASPMPELQLIAAVLALAIEDAMLSDPNPRFLAYNARFWLSSERRDAFSFRWCCEALGLDPDVAQAAILERIDGPKTGRRRGRPPGGGHTHCARSV